MFFLLTIDVDIINVDHYLFSINIIMFFSSLRFLFYDGVEILDGEFFVKRLEDVKSEKGEPAFIQHEIVGILRVFSGLISYLFKIFMQNILQYLILFTYFVDTKTRVWLGKMFVSDVKHGRVIYNLKLFIIYSFILHGYISSIFIRKFI